MRLLQFGYDYPDSLDEFISDMLSVYTNTIPIEAFVMIVFGTFAVASFIRQDSPIIPLGFIFLTGAAVVPMLPGIGMQLVTFVILFVGAGVLTLAWYMYSD